jgi:hypothetical protein
VTTYNNLNSSATNREELFTALTLYFTSVGGLIAIAVISDSFRSHHIFLTLAMVVGAWPLFSYVKRKDTYNLFLLAITLINVIYYCVQPFLPLDYYESPLLNLIIAGSEESDMRAAFYIFAGITSYVVAASLLKRYAVGGKRKPVKSLTRDLDRSDITRILLLLGISYFFWALLLGARVDIQYLAFVNVIMLFTLFGLSVVFILYCENKLRTPAKTLLAVFLVIHVSVAIASGFVALVIQIMLLIAFSYVAVRKRLPSVWLLGTAFVLAMVLLMFKALFREIYWVYSGTESGGHIFETAERVVGFLSIIIDNVHMDELGSLINAAFLRIGLFHTSTYVATYTPDYIPFLGGSTYEPLLYKLIPRFLMTDKPVEEMGQAFGHLYYFLDSADDLTSVNLPLMVEMYINGGLSWVIGGMALLAIVNLLLWKLVSGVFHFAEIKLAAHAVVFMHAALIESNFSLVYGGLLYTILVFWLVDVLLRLVHPATLRKQIAVLVPRPNSAR